MNSFPDTAFAQNVGLVQMTRVRSRWVVAVTVTAIVAFTLNLLFNHLGKRSEPDLLKAPH